MSDDKNTSLAIIPRTFDETRALSEYLSNASLVPVSARKQPHNAMAMIMAGAEIGLAPMAALRAYHVIEGVPRLTADTMHAVCLKRPDLVAYIHPVEQSPTRVVWKAKRRAEGAVEMSSTWDMERARKLPNFGKGPWVTNPQAMLNARAKAEIARLVAPDIVGGLYALEEEDAAAVEPAPAPNYTAPPAPAASTPAAAGTTPSGKANRTRKADAAAPAAPPVDVTPPPAGGVAQAARDHFADSQARVAAAAAPPEPEIVDAEIVDEQPAAHAAAESTEPDDGFGESPPPPAASDAERKAAEYIDKLATLTTKDAVAAWRVEASTWGQTQDVTIFDKLKAAYGAHTDKLKRAAAAAGGAK